MQHRIITISREFGSGGRTIGRLSAERLGIPCYDAELILRAAEESGFVPDYIEKEGERVSRGGWLSPSLFERSLLPSNQDIIWSAQKKVILEIAEKESCVIVGRCADYILKDKADCLNVFIHSSMENRAKRIVQEYGERPESPEARLREKDKRRAAYHRFYTDMKWGHAQNYHLCLDSGALGIDKCVDLIVQLY